MGGLRIPAVSRPLLELVTEMGGWIGMVCRSLNLRYCVTTELGAGVDVSALSGTGKSVDVLVLQIQLPIVDKFLRDVPEAAVGHFLRWDVGERRRLKCLLWRASSASH